MESVRVLSGKSDDQSLVLASMLRIGCLYLLEGGIQALSPVRITFNGILLSSDAVEASKPATALSALLDWFLGYKWTYQASRKVESASLVVLLQPTVSYGEQTNRNISRAWSRLYPDDWTLLTTVSCHGRESSTFNAYHRLHFDLGRSEVVSFLFVRIQCTKLSRRCALRSFFLSVCWYTSAAIASFVT